MCVCICVCVCVCVCVYTLVCGGMGGPRLMLDVFFHYTLSSFLYKIALFADVCVCVCVCVCMYVKDHCWLGEGF